MAIYEQSAWDLLNVVQNPCGGDDFLFLGEEGYVFTYRRNYQGLMARIHPKYATMSREKQGFFDIRGNMNNQNLTHQQLYNILLNTTTLEECQSVWRGKMPRATDEKKHALLSLAMLMFEQEINFGNESFQRKSHYSPTLANPSYLRPRDLLMGYIGYMFEERNTQCLSRFQNSNGLLLPPRDNIVKKKYFDILKNDNNAMALMARSNIVSAFRATANAAPRNPNR